MKRFISNSAGNRSGFILSLITVVVVSLFFISGISQAHIIRDMHWQYRTMKMLLMVWCTPTNIIRIKH